MEPIFFSSAAEFRAWLHENHASAAEVLVGFHKVATGRPSLTWSESVDAALSYGWIDGVRKSLGEEGYTIRFTPRRKGSVWSKVNLKKIEELRAAGLLHPAGLRAFEERDPAKEGLYSFERKDAPELDADLRAEFEANGQAWDFFLAQPAGYRRTVLHWVVSAKRVETRRSRLATLIECSARGERYEFFPKKAK